MDRAYFESADWLTQAREHGGFGRGAAWIDLLALTNQRATTFMSRGITRPIERGQSAYSKLALAERWGWSQAKVAATLAAWEKAGRIKCESGNDGTTISVLNYEAYQDGMLQQLVEQTGSKPGANREQGAEQTVTELGVGRGNTPQPEIPSDEVIEAFCNSYPGDLARGIPAKIPEEWWTGKVASWIKEKKWPTDWQRVLVLAFRGDFRMRHEKALGGLEKKPAATGRNGGGAASPAQVLFKLDKEIAELSEQIAGFEAYRPDLAEQQMEKLEQLKAERRRLA